MTDEKTNNLADGQTLGRYRILQKIGAGGMGEVYLAKDTRLDRPIALKILPADFAEDSERMRRFVLEAKATSALNHPNIITIYEIGESENTNFIAAEYIEGETLRARLKRNSFSADGCLEVAVQIASALEAAHRVNIVHRDIKPENIMIRPDGFVKILDFGIAKLTEKKAESLDAEAATRQQAQTALGMIIGTTAYMSPEQAQGKAVDARSDIFSFGIVLYEMLSGKRAFAGETPVDTIGAILHKEPTALNWLLPEIPAELERIINKALCKDCEERYHSAKDLLADLKELKQELDFQSKLKRAAPSSKEREAQTQIIKAVTDENKRTTSETTYANSIAVLPFSNLSADAENEYFCDGLAEELLNALAKIENLKVAARTSAFSFKGKNTNVSEIGNILNVKTILEGSVRKSGNKLRITVQLVNAADGYHLWSERYDREMRDIFDVQDEITLAVVDALKLKLFGDEKAALLKRYTDNTEAYELYLKGRYHYHKYTPEGWLKAIESFQKAVEKEPEYALAYANLASVFSFCLFFGVLPFDETIFKLRATTLRALEIDDYLDEAHSVLARLHFYYEWNWAEAEREFLRAIELNPDNAEIHHQYGICLAALGRYDEAVSEGAKALELDPLSLLVNLQVGWVYVFSGRLDEAFELTRKMLEMEPNFHGAYWQTGTIQGARGQLQEAVESYRKAAALGSYPLVLSNVGAVCGMLGRRGEAFEVLNRLLEMRKRQPVAAFNVARIYAGLNEIDKTIEWLEKAVEERNGELTFLNIKTATGYPFGESIRLDSRFQDILRRVGLPTSEIIRDKTTNEAGEARTAMLSPAIKSEKEIPETTSKTDEQASSEKPKTKTKWWLFGLLGLILLTSAFFAYRNFAPNSKQIESIAVLPFENASGSADLDYLSDGVSESVIDRLSQLAQLKVIARSSSFRYRGANLDLKEIANTLGVQAIVTGRVVPRGDSYQIRVDVTDARNNSQLWGESFTRKASDVQILQTDISREIADNLRLRLSGTQTQQFAGQGTTNPQAYELRLKGRYYFNKFGLPESFHKSVEYYEQAVAADPNYALAWAELSESYSFGGGRGLNGDERRSKQKASARKALELDPNLAEAHFALANIKRNEWEWEEAEREYRRAIELNPSLSGPHGAYAALLSSLKRFDEAFAEIKRRNELDPLSILGNAAAGDVYFRARRYDEAIRFYMKMLELDQASPDARQRLGDVYAAQGKYAEAIAEYQKALSLRAASDDPNIEALLAAVYVKAGRRDKSEEILKKLKTDGKDVQPRIMAILYAALGDYNEAFTQLEKAFAARAAGLVRIATEPYYDPLRSDPRFADLLRRMNLPQQKSRESEHIGKPL